MRRRIAALTAALALVPLLLAACSSPSPKHAATTTTTSPKLRGLTGCGADSSTALSAYLSGRPSNTTVTLPHDACFTVLGTVQIDSTTGLTINGNGATFYQSSPYSGCNITKHPILFLTSNTRLTIRNLGLEGSYNGSNGGVGDEGCYGVLAEANQTMTLSGLNVSNIQGDFLNLQFPADVGGGDLNTNVRITSSTFDNAGYHGVVIEGVGPTALKGNGATLSGDTFENMGVDAIDLEYDVYSSGTINPNGIASFVAEDNISFLNDTWTNFSDDWFASLQNGGMQVPGVQEFDVTLSGNTISSDTSYSLVEVNHTAPGATYGGATATPQYAFNGLTISNNRALSPAYPTTGGSISSPPPVGSAMTIENVTNVSITGNSFLFFDGFTYYFFQTPYMSVLQANGVNGLAVNNNTLNGAYDVIDPGSSGNTLGAVCNNHYGVNAGTLDVAC